MRKEKIIRYTLFTIGVVLIGCGVVFLFTQNNILAIICLSLGIISGFLSFVPYPFLKKDKEDDEDIES